MLTIEQQQELRNRFNPDGSDLRNHQIQLFKILQYFDSVCKKNNIVYYLSSGTCLGAIRHKGFIPWDDDIDVEMSREEYLKFELLFQENENFALQTYDNDLFYTEPFSKLRMKGIEVSEGDYDKRYRYRGPFLDIFIMEPAPFLPAMFCHLLLGTMRHFSFHISNEKWKLYIYKKWKKLNAWIIKKTRVIFTNKNSNILRHTYGTGCVKNIRVRNEIFPTRYAEFEGQSFPVPSDTDKYLKRLFGDYMKIPPKIHNHHIISNNI